MPKTIVVVLLILFVCVSARADEEPGPSGRYVPRHVLESESRQNAGRAANPLSAVERAPKVAIPQLGKALTENAPPQIQFKLIVADVAEVDLAEVEKAVGSITAVWKQPSIDNATIEDLKSRKLIKVISQPVLGTTAGGTATLSFDRTDVGLPGTPEEHYEFCLSADLKEHDIETNIKLTITYGTGQQTRRQLIDTGFKLRPGQIVALPMSGFYMRKSGEADRLHKVVFLNPGIRHAPPAFNIRQLQNPADTTIAPDPGSIPNARRDSTVIPNSRQDGTIIPNIVRDKN